jgi:hypothetical protein
MGTVGHRKLRRFDQKVAALIAKAEATPSRGRKDVNRASCPSGRCEHRADVHIEDGTCVECSGRRTRGPCAKPPAT